MTRIDLPGADRQPWGVPDAERWWTTLREIGSVKIMYVDLTPYAGREALALSGLHRDEQARWSRFCYPGPARRFALCRAALRHLLCQQLGCRNERLTFGAAQHGKPYAVAGNDRAPISFNVSHSGNHGLIAYAPGGRLGVDVEEYAARRDFNLLIESVFGVNERADLAATHGRSMIRLFYKLWTFKEALIKALGLGFSCDVSQFEIPADLRHGTSGTFAFPQQPTSEWRVEFLGTAEFAAAIAYEDACASEI